VKDRTNKKQAALPISAVRLSLGDRLSRYPLSIPPPVGQMRTRSFASQSFDWFALSGRLLSPHYTQSPPVHQRNSAPQDRLYWPISGP